MKANKILIAAIAALFLGGFGAPAFATDDIVKDVAEGIHAVRDQPDMVVVREVERDREAQIKSENEAYQRAQNDQYNRDEYNRRAACPKCPI